MKADGTTASTVGRMKGSRKDDKGLCAGVLRKPHGGQGRNRTADTGIFSPRHQRRKIATRLVRVDLAYRSVLAEVV